MSIALLRLALLLLALSVTGCSQGSTVHIAKKFSPGESLLTSADIRSINRTKGIYAGGRIVPEYITCAEPSPDIAKAISESFNFSGTFGIGGLPSGVSPEAAAAISLARAEGMATDLEKSDEADEPRKATGCVSSARETEDVNLVAGFPIVSEKPISILHIAGHTPPECSAKQLV